MNETPDLHPCQSAGFNALIQNFCGIPLGLFSPRNEALGFLTSEYQRLRVPMNPMAHVPLIRLDSEFRRWYRQTHGAPLRPVALYEHQQIDGRTTMAELLPDCHRDAYMWWLLAILVPKHGRNLVRAMDPEHAEALIARGLFDPVARGRDLARRPPAEAPIAHYGDRLMNNLCANLMRIPFGTFTAPSESVRRIMALYRAIDRPLPAALLDDTLIDPGTRCRLVCQSFAAYLARHTPSARPDTSAWHINFDGSLCEVEAWGWRHLHHFAHWFTDEFTTEGLGARLLGAVDPAAVDLVRTIGHASHRIDL